MVKTLPWEGKGKAQGSDIDRKIRKTIGWYNKQGNLQEQLMYKDVAPLLLQLDSKAAGSILNSLEGKEGQVKNPTAWIAAAARKQGAGTAGPAGAGWVPSGLGGKGGGGGDFKKISKTIGWYNRHGGLQQEIEFKKVAPLLNQLDSRQAGGILKSLEEKASEVRDPTAWLATAAKKAGASGGGGGGVPGGWVAVPVSALGGVPGSGGKDPKISKTIGWWNKQGGLVEEIRYSEVAPLLQQLGTGAALNLLKSLEGKESEIKNPTNYILAACRKAGAW